MRIKKTIGPTNWEETTSYSGKNLWIGICFFLLELFERFTFFGVVCNMIPFCTIQLGHQNSQAAILNLCFIGISTLTPLLVGWFVDVCGERNKLVYICLFLHFLGSALLSIIAFPLGDFSISSYHISNIPTQEQTRLFYGALLAISFGIGGIRFLYPLGTYSLQECEPQRPHAFCNWSSWIMNLNAVAVFLGISFIQYSGAWTLVLLFPFISTLLILITLQMVHNNLIYQSEKCCSLIEIFGVIFHAMKTCCLQSSCLGQYRTSWLDQAKEDNDNCCRNLYVEDTKSFLILLLLFILQLLCRMCVVQIPSGYYLQTMHSNLNLDGFLLPVAVMNIISILPLLILAPLMEYCSNCLPPSTQDGWLLSACIIAGNLCAVLSVMVAGFLEIYRKHFPSMEQPRSGKLLSVSSMPCVYLVLPYLLLGMAEMMVSPAFSVIHRFVPRNIRGSSKNLLTLFNGFGCFTGALMVQLVSLFSEGNWFPNTLNKGNLESFFFFLASLTLLNVLGFWSVSQRYRNLNHFSAQNIHGHNLEETFLLHEKSLKFYGSTQRFSSSIDFWETAL
ncbi:solute carrier family 15 member 5 [Suncus etruscus]|uniref:solute carrier family 15 member 5 n=1 Tax=Suncus etruscus TaxID=109475 RepID=UPI00210FBC32|nr:solute carrier family 15 member 5 [Suncus etruscus]